MEKSSKEYLVVFLMEGEKFKLRICLRKDFIFVVGSAAVGTTLEFAAFRSGPDAKYSRASAFLFSLTTTMVFAAVRTHFPRKNISRFHVDRHLVIGKEISSKTRVSAFVA